MSKIIYITKRRKEKSEKNLFGLRKFVKKLRKIGF